MRSSFLVGKKKLGVIIDKVHPPSRLHHRHRDARSRQGPRLQVLHEGRHHRLHRRYGHPGEEDALIEEAEKQTVKIDRQFKRGFITNDERYRLVVHQWEQTIKDVTGALQENLDRFNPIYMMADSGARGSMNQIRQLAGMRGLMADTNGRTIEIPIKANFREGLSALEYFISSRGARKG